RFKKSNQEVFSWEDTIRANTLTLNFVGLWPAGYDTYKFDLYGIWSAISQFSFIYAHTFFQAINIIFIFDDLQAVTSNIFVTLSELLTLLKTYCMVRNMKILKQLMVTLKTDMFQPKNQRQKDLLKP